MTTPMSSLLVFAVFAAGLGVYFRSGELIAVAQVSAIVILSCRIYCSRVGAAIRIARSVYPRAYEDERCSVALTVVNRGLFPAYLVEFQDHFTPALEPRKFVVADRLGRTPVVLRYEAGCSRGRGRYALGPVHVKVSDPFGFFSRTLVLEVPGEILVLPKTFPIQRLELGGLRTRYRDSENSVSSSGHSASFYGTREYRPGDNIRHIHWRASARWGTFVLKEFETIAAREVTLLLDASHDSVRGVLRRATFESAVRIAASIAEYASAKGHPLQLLAQGEEPVVLPPGAGTVHLLRILEALAGIRAIGRVPLPDLLTSAVRFVPEGSTVVLIFNTPRFARDRVVDSLCALRSKGANVIAVLIDDATYLRVRRVEAPETAQDSASFLAEFGVDVHIVTHGADLGLVFAKAVAE